MAHARGLLGTLLLAGAVCAQGDPFEQLELRVATVRAGGRCVVDRGERDQVAVDDRVVLMPRNGPPLTGRVVQVENRTALVQLLDPKATVAAGTRGHVLLPKTRLRAAKPDPEPQAQQPTGPDPAQPQAGDPQPGVGAGDDEWRPGMPLLGRHRPPRPSERPSEVRGRVYGAANLVQTLDSTSQSFLRAGAAVDVNNVDGNGGRLRFHGDLWRGEEFSGNTGNDLRVYELSYETGGTRFSPLRWQAGRFLPRDMPEFGLLDGIEVGYRTEGGDRYGASLGYLPELDDDMESLADLQVAMWYVWNSDVAERLSFAFGYQKSWHRFDGDRDLFVLRGRYFPEDGWDLSSSVWIDIYDNDDNVKDENFEVTRANLFTARRGEEGGVEFFYDHEEYPQLLRNDNPQTLLPQTLIGAHVDRASLHMWTGNARGTRWFTRLTGWIDEEHEGGAAEVGVDFAGLFGEHARSGIAGYHVEAFNSATTGVRLQHGGDHGFGRLDVLYELGFVHYYDFPAAFNDLVQHRIGALVTTDLGGGWDATFSLDTTFWDEELSFGVGIYMQRLF